MKVLFIDSIGKFFSGLLFAIAGCFVGVKIAIALVFVFIVADLMSGIWVAVKLREPVLSKKLWETIPKLFWSIMVVLLTFLLDKYLLPGRLDLHNGAALLICGFEFWSILENAGKITNHPVFRVLRKYMSVKIQKETGIDVDKRRDTE